MARHISNSAALLLSAALAGCSSQSRQSAPPPAQVTAAAQTLDVAAAQDCPWPATAAQFEDTTLTARNRATPSPRIGAFGAMKAGCAILAFTLDDVGNVAVVNVLSENPAGFGKVATRLLHGNDYAVGADTSTVFIVRVSGEILPAGGALIALAFKDSVINLEIPP